MSLGDFSLALALGVGAVALAELAGRLLERRRRRPLAPRPPAG
jgi:hypothetical protein